MQNNTEPSVLTVGHWAQAVAQSWQKLAQGGQTPSAQELADA